LLSIHNLALILVYLQESSSNASTIKENPISYGKDPNAFAVATLYSACLEEGEKISQTQIADAGGITVVTLRKRFQDVKSIVP
jgi:transcription initiation factor TFIIB